MPPSAYRRIAPVLAVIAAWMISIAPGLPAASPALAADPPKMEARVLLQGHARIGSWIAVEVRIRNDGPPMIGELRLQAGAEGGTRYAMVADLPTTSDKSFVLHAQPPAFGQQLEVVLASGSSVVSRQKVAVTIHDPSQLIVGVVAERPAGVAGNLSLPQVQNQQSAVVVPLGLADLPSRIEAWSALDRLVWQDVDAAALSTEQLAALRGWLALGGRLVVVGGTGGIGALAGFPDDILPYRPTAAVDVAPASIASLLGTIPSSAVDVPALAGELTRGRTLATSGDRVIAADTAYGAGTVTLIGIDPSVGWIAESKAAEGLWRGILPVRSAAAVALADDSTLLQALNNLPSLALPPIGGLLLLLLAYIILIGPINYLVLRRIDRREWAWVTMPVLIAGFAVGAYAFGSALRGSSIIVNEVAIVRGAPDATEAAAQVYLGVFSPTRGTYQVAVRGGALLSSPIAGDIFGGQGLGLDVVQGDPSRVRDLSVGFGSLRAIRAESASRAPKVHVELNLVDGVLTGSVRNDSSALFERPAVVLGSNVAMLPDLKPGAETQVRVAVTSVSDGQSLGDRIFGQQFFGGQVAASEAASRDQTRHWVVDQLTNERQKIGGNGQLNADGPVLLGWGRGNVLDVQVEGQTPQRVANVLYYVPVEMGVHGKVRFSGSLIRSATVDGDAAIMKQDPSMLFFGLGSLTVSYRPVSFSGSLTVDKVLLELGFGAENQVGANGLPVQPIPERCLNPKTADPRSCPLPQPPEQSDGVPEIEVFDRTGGGTWHRLPHFAQGVSYELSSPLRYVDPATGVLLVRFVNERQEPVNAFLNVSIEGTVE